MLIIFEVKIELPIIRLGSLSERLKQVLDAVRGEHRLAKDTHDLEHRPAANLEVVFDDGNEAVGNDCDVNLYADGILGLSPESLDSEMLFDPLEDNPSDDTRVLLLVLLLCKAYALVFEDIVSSIQYAFSIDNLVCWFTLFSDDKKAPNTLMR